MATKQKEAVKAELENEWEVKTFLILPGSGRAAWKQGLGEGVPSALGKEAHFLVRERERRA